MNTPQPNNLKKCPTCNRVKIPKDSDVCAACSNKGRAQPNNLNPSDDWPSETFARLDERISLMNEPAKGLFKVEVEMIKAILEEIMVKILFGKNDDRQEIIDRSEEAMDRFGWNYGGQTASITKTELEALSKGKILAMDVNGGEYTQFIALADKELPALKKAKQEANLTPPAKAPDTPPTPEV